MEERLAVTNEISRIISGDLEVKTILQTVVDASLRLTGSEYAAFFYRNKTSNGETIFQQAWAGAVDNDKNPLKKLPATRLFEFLFAKKMFFQSSNVSRVPEHASDWEKPPVASLMAIPVIALSGNAIGGLFFSHTLPDRFNTEHRLLISTIASQAAVSLDNAKLYEEVNALNSRKDDFIGFASHELKTPLTTIKGYLQLAHDMNMPVADLYPRLIKQVERLEILVHDLLDMSSVQTGKMEYRFGKHSIRTLVNDAVEAMDTNNRKIDFDLPKNELVVFVDNAKISQVLVNILSNAVKYSPADTAIKISATTNENTVLITVSDQGIGIEPPDMGQIFNQFYRVGNTRVKGSGLGLYIAKEIVEAHSGTIWASSTPGVGSSFFVRLPMKNDK